MNTRLLQLTTLHSQAFYTIREAVGRMPSALNDASFRATADNIALVDYHVEKMRAWFRTYCKLVDLPYEDPTLIMSYSIPGALSKSDMGLYSAAMMCYTLLSHWQLLLAFTQHALNEFVVAVVCNGKLKGYARLTGKSTVNKADVRALFPTSERNNVFGIRANIKFYLSGFGMYDSALVYSSVGV